MPIGVLEFYSGIGGLHLALERTNIDAKVVQAFDWDQTACKVYSANYGDIIRKVDISKLTPDALASLNADLWLLSPACQPYTVLNPNAKGAEDPRAQSFLHLVKSVLPDLAASDKHPRRLLVENVAGFEESTTRQILLSTLQSIGYSTLELLITPLQFGIPNSRLRYYLLAKKSPLQFSNVTAENCNAVWRHIPGTAMPWADPRFEVEAGDISIPTVNQIHNYLDNSGTSDDYLIPDKVLEKWGRLFDIVKPSARRTCCFTRGYTQLVERAGSIVQENESLDTTSTFDRFLEAQSKGDPHAVEILHPLKLRYFSPSELLRIFAFDKPTIEHQNHSKFIWPDTISKKTKYKLIGNSVNVEVVQHLIEYLFDDPL